MIRMHGYLIGEETYRNVSGLARRYVSLVFVGLQACSHRMLNATLMRLL